MIQIIFSDIFIPSNVNGYKINPTERTTKNKYFLIFFFINKLT